MNWKKNNASESVGADSMNELRLEAARKRLAESTGPEDAIDGLREIVATFLGSEELGLFRVDCGSATFQAFWSFGTDLKEYDLRGVLGDAGLQRVMRGEYHVELAAGERSGRSPKARAFIPIRFSNQTIAILAILRLLPQKLAFDASDIELFKLLSDEAATPLFGQSLFGPGVSGAGDDSKPLSGEPGVSA
jgi:GAF domain-containing protein